MLERGRTVIKSAADAVQIWYLHGSPVTKGRKFCAGKWRANGGAEYQNIRCNDEKWGVEETDGGDAGWRRRGVNVWWRIADDMVAQNDREGQKADMNRWAAIYEQRP